MGGVAGSRLLLGSARTRVIKLSPAESDFRFGWNFKENLIPAVSRASIGVTLMADKADQSPPPTLSLRTGWHWNPNPEPLAPRAGIPG